uniref:C2H2-type domain-containing protein n=1 Tax=Timema cristinae TaxID=61476 RepID=A0A7R9GZR9_TIMCR|nr:unnamed protein product [Timema cristinae]
MVEQAMPAPMSAPTSDVPIPGPIIQPPPVAERPLPASPASEPFIDSTLEALRQSPSMMYLAHTPVRPAAGSPRVVAPQAASSNSSPMATPTHHYCKDEIQTLEDSEPLNLISTNMADNMTRLVNSIMEDTDLDSLNHHSDSDQSDGIDPNSDQLPILPSISEISEEFLSGSSNIGLFGHLMIHVIDENGHPVMLPTDSLETGDLGPSLQLQSMPNVNIDEPSVAPEYLSLNPPFRTFEIDPSLIEGSNRQILDQEFFIEHKLEVLHSLVPIEDRQPRRSYVLVKEDTKEDPYMCDLCGASFERARQYYGHLHQHTGERNMLDCTAGPVCSSINKLNGKTKRERELPRANSSKPLSVKPYPCSVCGRRFTQLSALHQHKTSHQIKRSIPCIFCRKMFKSFSDMRKHVRKMHKANLESIPENQAKGVLKLKETPQRRSYYCKVCGDTFKFSALLKKHEAQHDNETALQCKDCDQAYDSVEYFKTHSCQFKGNMSYSEIPKTTFMPTEEEQAALNLQLQNLLDEHNSLMDDPTRGLTSEIVIYVTREGQDEPTQIEIKPISTGPFLSPIKDTNNMVNPGFSAASPDPYKQFLNKTICLQIETKPITTAPFISPIKVINTMDSCELSATSPDPNKQCAKRKLAFDNPSTDSDDTNKNKPYRRPLQLNVHTIVRTHYVDQQKFICSVCGISFAWKSTMNKHMTTIHSDYPLPKLSCETCGKQYSTATQVQDHVRRDHNKERPHMCKTCNKTFYKKCDLKIHERTHTQERPYICETCGKRFYHVSHMIRHERVHTGLKPYSCDDCGRQFTQSSSLKYHRQYILHFQASKTGNEKNGIICADPTMNQAEFRGLHTQANTTREA